MKRRRTLIVSLLLVTALCMGIGYAAVSGTLVISGTSTYTAQTVTLEATTFTQTTPALDPTPAIKGTLTAGNPATFTVSGLSLEGDKLVGTITVTNNSKFNVKLTNAAINYTGSQISVVCVDTTDAVLSAGNVIIAADGGTKEVKVTITMLKDYIGDLAENKETFTITITGEATNETP